MSGPLPATALDLVWLCVREARWTNRTSSFVRDVFSCYLGFGVTYMERVTNRALRVQIEAQHEDAFRNAFPDARRDPHRPSVTRGHVWLRLPIERGGDDV